MTSPRTIPNIRRYRTSMKMVRQDLDAELRPVVRDIQTVILFNSLTDGSIPLEREDVILARAGTIVSNFFTAGDNRRSFDANYNGLTPYARLLNRYYVRVALEAVVDQYLWMKRNIPEDVFNWLAQPDIAESAENSVNGLIYEDINATDADSLRIFRPNPLAQYDAMHTWVDPKGYRLSDRIWNAELNTRRKIDGLLADGIRSGMSARELSERLEQFVLPSRKNIRTNKPYGTNASYDAMRLARTEIARAANEASRLAAVQNPYVNKIDVARSRNGDRSCPICPEHATIGIDGERLREPYGVDDARISPYHPHCLCHVRPVVDESVEEITARLRGAMNDARYARQPKPNPAQGRSFVQRLLRWAGLVGLVGQFREGLPF